MRLPTSHHAQRARSWAILTTLLLLAALVAACAPVGTSSTGLKIEGVWARPAKMMGEAMPAETPMEGMEGMSHGSGANSAVYMKISNPGQQADRLVSAKADVAKTIELHETIMEGDVMKMQPVAGGIEVPAGGSVELKPGGLHVMLIGLTKDLNVGDKFPVTLQFEQGGTLTVEAEVRQP